MIYTDPKDFDKGTYVAVRQVGAKHWLEPFGSSDEFINNPLWEMIKYDDLSDIDNFPE